MPEQQQDKSWFEQAYDFVTDNGVGAGADMLTNGNTPGGGVLGAISVMQGGEQMGEGMGQIAEGDTAMGALNTAAGLGGGLAGGISATGALGSAMSWAGGGLAEAYIAGETIEAGGAVAASLMNGGAALEGAATAGTGAAGLGTAVGSAGALPIIAAVGGGLAGGVATANRGQDYIADTGLLGYNEDGSGKNWSDWGADTAWDAREAVADWSGNETIGDIAGYGALAGTTIAGAAGAAVTGVAGFATDAYSLLTSW